MSDEKKTLEDEFKEKKTLEDEFSEILTALCQAHAREAGPPPDTSLPPNNPHTRDELVTMLYDKLYDLKNEAWSAGYDYGRTG